ncbi:transcription factor LRL3 [Cryptomeria japonica]|uniref:transcription factor LRL3 n=1 Tax=Cryptomeria japonica TaxID=3369 RepID=UPI0027DA6375|nr:transcription factor LRL3 [Cryptomeria japonica]
MECWLHDQRPVNGERNIEISSFAERQAWVKAQLLGSLESCAHLEQRFWPCDQLLLNQEDLYGAGQNSTAVSSWEPDGAFNFGTSNFNGEESQPLGFEFGSLPIQMQGFNDFQFFSQDENFGFAELNFPAWQTQPSGQRTASAELPRNSSFYTLEDVMKKLPRVDPLFIPSPPMSLSIPPSPQFSSDTSLSSCQSFSGRVSCPPPPLQPSEGETEHLNQLIQSQTCRKPPYASVEPPSVAARHRRNKIREKISSLEKLIPQGSKLDTARMLDEAIKYIKFLQAQFDVLESMPPVDSEPHLKSNPKIADDNVNIYLKPNFNGRNALAMQRSGSASASPKKLSTDQMLHSLLSSSRIQKKLFSEGKVIVTVQQKEMLASKRPDLAGDFSNFFFD